MHSTSGLVRETAVPAAEWWTTPKRRNDFFLAGSYVSRSQETEFVCSVVCCFWSLQYLKIIKYDMRGVSPLVQGQVQWHSIPGLLHNDRWESSSQVGDANTPWLHMWCISIRRHCMDWRACHRSWWRCTLYFAGRSDGSPQRLWKLEVALGVCRNEQSFCLVGLSARRTQLADCAQQKKQRKYTFIAS